jgi:hypothetical protein
MLLLLVGCLDPISNRLFFEDAEFLDALPSAEDDRVQVQTHSADPQGGPDDGVTQPGEELEAPEGAPLLLVLTVDSVNDVNAMVDGFLSIVDLVRSTPPSSRTDDTRSWGPFPMDDVPDHDVEMVSERDGVGEFTWRFETAAHGTSSWTPFFSGVHLAGATVSGGAGTFVFDGIAVDALHGSDENNFFLEVNYDHIEESKVDFLVWNDADRDTLRGEFDYEIGSDGAGSFTFDTADPKLGLDGKDSGKPEHWHVTTRWVPDIGGRGDAVVSEGDLGALTVTYTECWLPDGTLLYQGDTLGFVTKPVGTPEDCTVAP